MDRGTYRTNPNMATAPAQELLRAGRWSATPLSTTSGASRIPANANATEASDGDVTFNWYIESQSSTDDATSYGDVSLGASSGGASGRGAADLLSPSLLGAKIDVPDVTDIPDSYDIRNISGRSMASMNRNQHIPHYCGSCWAVAGATALSDRLKLARRGGFPDIDLSSQVTLRVERAFVLSSHAFVMS